MTAETITYLTRIAADLARRAVQADADADALGQTMRRPLTIAEKRALAKRGEATAYRRAAESVQNTLHPMVGPGPESTVLPSGILYAGD